MEIAVVGNVIGNYTYEDFGTLLSCAAYLRKTLKMEVLLFWPSIDFFPTPDLRVSENTLSNTFPFVLDSELEHIRRDFGTILKKFQVIRQLEEFEKLEKTGAHLFIIGGNEESQLPHFLQLINKFGTSTKTLNLFQKTNYSQTANLNFQ